MSKILIAALADELGHARPETKYTLLRLVQRTEAGLDIPGSARQLAKLFRLAEAKVRLALKELSVAGILVCPAQQKKCSPGRPVTTYELASEYISRLRRRANDQGIHTAAIDLLLRGESDYSSIVTKSSSQEKCSEDMPFEAVRACRQPDRLSIVNRLVLAVLLMRADRFGVVRDLGTAELSKLTGLNSERLKTRTITLLKACALLAVSPGTSGVSFFKKTKSVYFVNLAHDEIAEASVCPAVLVSYRDLQADDILDTAADLIYFEARSATEIKPLLLSRHDVRVSKKIFCKVDWTIMRVGC